MLEKWNLVPIEVCTIIEDCGQRIRLHWSQWKNYSGQIDGCNVKKKVLENNFVGEISEIGMKESRKLKDMLYSSKKSTIFVTLYEKKTYFVFIC